MRPIARQTPRGSVQVRAIERVAAHERGPPFAAVHDAVREVRRHQGQDLAVHPIRIRVDELQHRPVAPRAQLGAGETDDPQRGGAQRREGDRQHPVDGCARGQQQAGRRARGQGGGHQHQPLDPVGMPGGQDGRDQTAHGVAVHGEPVPSQSVGDLDQELDVAADGEGVLRRRTSASEAGQVDGDHRAVLGETLHHLDPGHRRATEPVHEQLWLGSVAAAAVGAQHAHLSSAHLEVGVHDRRPARQGACSWTESARSTSPACRATPRECGAADSAPPRLVAHSLLVQTRSSTVESASPTTPSGSPTGPAASLLRRPGASAEADLGAADSARLGVEVHGFPSSSDGARACRLEPVLHPVADRLRPTLHTDLAVPRADVGLDRVDAEVGGSGDLLVGQTLGDEGQDLGLARAEPLCLTRPGPRILVECLRSARARDT